MNLKNKKISNRCSISDKSKSKSFDKNYFKNFYLKKLPNKKNIKILDIGCGNGKYLNILKEFGFNNLFGIDISKQKIEIAKKSMPTVKCIDAVKFLKKSNQKYDVILIIDVLEHIDLDETFQLIDLVYKSLNNYGKVIIQVPNAMALFSPLRYSDITHKRAYTTSSLTQTIHLSSFKKFSFYELPPFIHGIKSLIRNILWHILLKPLILTFQYIAYGNNFNKIYTANILCVLEKT
jgi:2-polyprenyl-3-methyl-5-hydroxy-6-metoxy-1,4-benzoquinol methylase